MANGKSNSVALADVSKQIDEVAATQSDIVNWQQSLQLAMFEAIKPEDVTAIVQKQVEKAKAGDPNAIKFVMSHVLGTTRPVSIKQTLVVTDVETAARMAKGGKRTS